MLHEDQLKNFPTDEVREKWPVGLYIPSIFARFKYGSNYWLASLARNISSFLDLMLENLHDMLFSTIIQSLQKTYWDPR